MSDTAVLRDVRPDVRPANPDFLLRTLCEAAGVVAVGAGWCAAGAESSWAAGPKGRLLEVIERSKAILGMPADWRLGIVPGSDTGAIEMAMWSLLGARGVDILAFESFSEAWATDVVKQLKLDARVLGAGYGRLPDLAAVDPGRDLVLAWNGTTSGVRLPHADFIAADRAGLVLCDATSAAFAMDLPWDKLDVVTWSWQKVLGGEAAHGMLALSPRAVERLLSHKPVWPMPKVFRLLSGGKAGGGGVPRRDDQHAEHAVRRGRAGRTPLGWSRWAGCTAWSGEARLTWRRWRPGSSGPGGRRSWPRMRGRGPARRSAWW